MLSFLVIFAPAWGWIVFANLLLWVNQGLCWSTTVIMKYELSEALFYFYEKPGLHLTFPFNDYRTVCLKDKIIF